MLFLKALIIGFSLAMPVGPIGMLCIKNTLAHGFKIGLAVGLGAALCDALYGFLAGGGLVFITEFLLKYSSLLQIVGSAILFYLGAIEIKNAKIPSAEIKIQTHKFFKTILATFFIAAINPVMIMLLIGIFAAIGGGASIKGNIPLLIIGVFIGSMSWWIFLATTTAIIRHKISAKFMARIKIISGLILIGFAIYGLFHL